MIAGIEGVLNLATASGEDLARVSDIVTDNLTAFKLTAKDTDRVVDVMASTITNSNTDINKMGDSLKYAGSVAGSLGYSFEDSALAIGLMASSGVKASQAGTSLRRTLLGIQGGVELNIKGQKEYKIATEDSTGKTRALRDVLKDMRKGFNMMTDSQKASNAESIAGKTGMTGLLAIMNASEDDFNSLSQAIDNSAGSTQRMADIMKDTAQGAFDEMKSAVQGALLKVFEAIAPVVTDVAKGVTKLANAFTELSPSTQSFIVGALGITALIGPFMFLTGQVVKLIGKIRAVPTVLSRMNDKSIERQVNSWLKWNNVSATQASKLRAVARDLDRVKKGGHDAVTPANRLNKELNKLKVNPRASTDMNKLKASVSQTKNETRKLAKEMKMVRPTNMRIGSVRASSGVSTGNMGRDIGSRLAQDMTYAFTSEVGALGGTAGMIFGNIIGDTAGMALSRSITGGGFKASLVGALKGIGSFALSAMPYVAIFGGVALGMKAIADRSKEVSKGVSSVTGGMTKSGEQIKGMSKETQDALKGIIDKITVLDEKTGQKMVDVKVKYTQEVQAESAQTFGETQEKMKARLQALSQNNKAYAEEVSKVNEKIKNSYVQSSKDIQDAEVAIANTKEFETDRIMAVTAKGVAYNETLHAQELANMLANGATLTEINNKKIEQEKTLASEKERIFKEELVRGQEQLFNEKKQAEEVLTAKVEAINEEYNARRTAILNNEALDKETKQEALARAEQWKEKSIVMAEAEAEGVGNAVNIQVGHYKKLIDEMENSGQISKETADSMRKSLDALADRDVTAVIKIELQGKEHVDYMNSMRGNIEKPINVTVNAKEVEDAQKKSIALQKEIDTVDAKKPSVDVQNNFDEAKNKANAVDSAIKNIDPFKQVVIDIVERKRQENVGASTPAKKPPSPKKKAKGGQLTSGLTIVGERGAELIDTSKGRSTVTPLRSIDRAMGGNSSKGLDIGGNAVYNITIVGANKSTKQIFDEIQQYTSQQERMRGRRTFNNG